MNHPITVLRNFSLLLALFDYFKKFQRSYQALHRVSLTNSEVLAIILTQHQHFAAAAVAAT